MDVQDAADLLGRVEELLSKLTSERSLLDEDARGEDDKRCRLIMRQMAQSLREAEQRVAVASADVLTLVNKAHELRCERRCAASCEAMEAAA
jgi:hypothetical protein